MIVRSHAMVFAVTKFVQDCEGRRVELGLNQREIMTLADYNNYHRLTRVKPVNIEMKNFLALCNVFDLDPRDYFELKA